MTEPTPAATVMVARSTGTTIEVLMLRRSSRSAFMPDVFVFPGGRVDEADRSAAAWRCITGDTGALESAYFFAAARETFEEAGLLFTTRPIDGATLEAARMRMFAGTRTFAQTLADLRTTLDAGAACYFSRWITPPGEGRRFDARFFVARAPVGQVAKADSFETHDGIWITPQDALARNAAGDFALIFPTIKHLERLSEFTSVEALLDFARTKTIVPVMPHLREGVPFVEPATLEGAW